MATTPALTMPYGKADWMDEYKQKQTQGYNLPQRAIMAAEYGDRFGELQNQLNMQKWNRELALKDREFTANDAYRNRILDINEDTSNKAFWGQLGGAGLSALLNYDNIKNSSVFKDIAGGGKALYDWATGDSPTFGDSGTYGINDPTGYGGNIDQYQYDIDTTGLEYGDQFGNFSPEWDPSINPSDYGFNIDQFSSEIGSDLFDAPVAGWEGTEAALSGVDAFGDGSMSFLDPTMATDFSMPWFSMAKYGTKGLNALAEANDIQQLSNFTEPLTGMFDALSTSLGKMVTETWGAVFDGWF